MKPTDQPPQTFRQTVWRVLWTLFGLALCGLAVAAMVFKIGQVADGLTGREAFDAILIGACMAMVLAACGFGLLGLALGGSGTKPDPVGEGFLPYDDPAENARQRRLRIKARLHRTACFILGLALLLLGPQMFIDGLNDGPRDPALSQPKGGGSVGGGVAMTVIGLVAMLYSIIEMGMKATRRHHAEAPTPTPPHPEHTFPD